MRVHAWASACVALLNSYIGAVKRDDVAQTNIIFTDIPAHFPQRRQEYLGQNVVYKKKLLDDLSLMLKNNFLLNNRVPLLPETVFQF